MKSSGNSSPRQSKVLVPLAVAGVSGAVSIGLLVAMIAKASLLVRFRLTGHLWYVLLLFLGVFAALAVFASFKSFATYSGKVLNGSLQLGGPVVVMLVIVILGFFLAPPGPGQFDITVRVQGETGHQSRPLCNQGLLSLDLGADRREQPIDKKGEVRFSGIPNALRDRSVPVTLQDESYELAEPNLALKLNQEVYYITVRAKRFPLHGTVTDQAEQPLVKASVTISGQRALTDADGQFELPLPADLPEYERTVTIAAVGFEPHTCQAIPGGGPLQIQLIPMRGYKRKLRLP